MALDPGILDDLSKRLADAMPEGLRTIRRDLERNFRAVLESGLARLDLVTREEFDVQAELLARTRRRLEELTARLAELEAALDADAATKR